MPQVWELGGKLPGLLHLSRLLHKWFPPKKCKNKCFWLEEGSVPKKMFLETKVASSSSSEDRSASLKRLSYAST